MLGPDTATSRKESPDTSVTGPMNGLAAGNGDRMRTRLFEIRDLGFSYPDGTEAIRGLTFDVEQGRSIAITGPSGCGKSTLLYLLAGLNKATAGTVKLGADTARNSHPLAMVFQKDTLLPWLTVHQNVSLYSKFERNRSRARKREVAHHVDELLHLVGLDGFSDYYPYQLSGGMRRRAQFLSAIAPMPSVLLLDEPFSSLDEPTRVALHSDVLRIVGELEMTLVVVTHDIPEAITLCDEVMILTRRPASVYRRHSVDFQAGGDAFAVRERQEFLDLYATVWRELSEQIRAAGEAHCEESLMEEHVEEHLPVVTERPPGYDYREV